MYQYMYMKWNKPNKAILLYEIPDQINKTIQHYNMNINQS